MNLPNSYLGYEDFEDAEQEKAISKWLAETVIEPERILLPYTNSKGNPRNSRVRASISLDQKIRWDFQGTFADIIGGSDGRDLFDGKPVDEVDPLEIINCNLMGLLKEKELVKWVTLILKSSVNIKRTHWLTSLTASGWWKQLNNFST